MDFNKLKEECIVFAQKSEKAGFPFSHFCLVEAFEGVSNTPYTMHIAAEWIKGMDCAEALQILTPIMFESMTPEARQNIFTINIFDDAGELHCVEYPLIEDGILVAA